MLVLGADNVRALLDPDALIEALAGAMADLSAGAASMPPRVAALVDERDALLGAMPGYVPSLDVLAAKLVTLFPGNAGTPIPTHQALIAVFDPATGEPVALMDGTEITAARTAAGSALATRLLAREDAATLAILGTGVQARAHAHAIPRVREIAEIRVAGRDEAKARALADELGPIARAVTSFDEAARGADIVCAGTHAAEPVVHRPALAPGAHVNSVGYHTVGREIDEATVADALLFVESRATALAPVPAGANDLAGVDPDRVVEIGELVLGRRPGRTAPDQITLYKSVGVAVQDAAAAAIVLAAARERGAGNEVSV
jgi:ornithine cyclodeaminase/alanine dehydrogenase-like protein (mu-crystallin family)